MAGLMNRVQFNRLKYLLGLPYVTLLQQLVAQQRRGSKFVPRTMLHLSAYHDCPDLYKLSTALNNNAEQSKLVSQWSNIIRSSMSKMYPNQLSSQPMTSQTVLQYFRTTKNQLQYLQTRSYPSQLKTDHTNALQLQSFGIPLLINGTFIYEEQQIIKQQYVRTLNQVLKVGGGQILEVLPVHKLFPYEIFNITDQPMVKDIYFKYLYPHLLRNGNKKTRKTIGWLARFGLPCDQYSLLCLNQINNNRTQQKSIGDDLDLANDLFVVLRKLVGKTEYNQLQNTHRIVQQIMKRVLKGQITKIQSEQVLKIISQQQKIQGLKLALLKSQENSQATQQIKQTALVIVNYKLIRLLLLYFHLCLIKKDQKGISDIKKFLNSQRFQPIILSCLELGDTFIELQYACDLYQQHYKKTLFQQTAQQVKKAMQEIRQKLKKLNIQIEKEQKIDSLWSRAHNVQYLLTSQSRILHSKDIQHVFNKKQRKNLLYSIVNDSDFLANFPTDALNNVISSQIARNLKLTVKNQTIGQNYPYCPTFRVEDKHKNKKFYYIKNSFSKHNRLHSSNESVRINPSNMEQFQHEMNKLARARDLKQI